MGVGWGVDESAAALDSKLNYCCCCLGFTFFCWAGRRAREGLRIILTPK